MLGLMIWRISLVGRREPDVPSKVSKAFELQPILLAVAVVLALIYLWIALDLVLAARQVRGAGNPALWFLVLAAYFALGWQIGDINLVKLATQARAAGPFLVNLAWPWERAIYREPMPRRRTSRCAHPVLRDTAGPAGAGGRRRPI
jgi:hypothetical protein